MSIARTEGVMGIPWTVAVRGEVSTSVLDDVFAELRAIDELFSTYQETSAVTRISAGLLRLDDAGPLVLEVHELCERYAASTLGFFSAWVDGRFDPTGLVKGWAIARAAAILDRASLHDYFVDGAGDVFARGEGAPHRQWRVGIRHPIQRDKVVGVIRARDLAVATSGTYERGAHIRDPHTGARATELLSLTVVGPDIVEADVYATAGFAMGYDALAFIASRPGYEALAIDNDLSAASTPGFDALRAG